MISDKVVVRRLGLVNYQDAFDRMRLFSSKRDDDTVDEFWLLQHQPVFTQGYSCRHVPVGSTDIPVISTDRGGQITYHGPGQIIVYLLLDIKRRNQGIRNLVHLVESAVIAILDSYGVEGETRPDAPGVYVLGQKIASLGIRIARGCSYHGLSLNVDMDTAPFMLIDVCGIRGLEVTTFRQLGIHADINEVEEHCISSLSDKLGYHKIVYS